jgi:hypothetical protein
LHVPGKAFEDVWNEGACRVFKFPHKNSDTVNLEDYVSQDKAMVRELVERIEGVTRTYFELEMKGRNRKKTLVVEVNFDLDSNSSHYSRAKIESIEDTFTTVLREENSDVVSKLKIVSRAHLSTDKSANATGHGATSTKNVPTDVRSSPN